MYIIIIYIYIIIYKYSVHPLLWQDFCTFRHLLSGLFLFWNGKDDQSPGVTEVSRPFFMTGNTWSYLDPPPFFRAVVRGSRRYIRQKGLGLVLVPGPDKLMRKPRNLDTLCFNHQTWLQNSKSRWFSNLSTFTQRGLPSNVNRNVSRLFSSIPRVVHGIT